MAGGKEIEIGALGSFRFDPGCYAYVGSAQNGLMARLRRHTKLGKPLHWHIDYLREHTEIISVAVAAAAREYECLLAEALLATPGASVPAPGFGASDCQCATHLVYFACPPRALTDPAMLLPTLKQIPI